MGARIRVKAPVSETDDFFHPQGSQNGNDASFECMPMNVDILDSAPGYGSAASGGGACNSTSSAFSFHSRRTSDCRRWNPDMPELLGLYHAYVRGYNKDTM
jgi:hypothetical protein